MAQEFGKLTLTITGPDIDTVHLEGINGVLVLADVAATEKEPECIVKMLIGTNSQESRARMMAALLLSEDSVTPKFREAVLTALAAKIAGKQAFSKSETIRDEHQQIDNTDDPDSLDGPMGDFLRKMAGGL